MAGNGLPVLEDVQLVMTPRPPKHLVRKLWVYLSRAVRSRKGGWRLWRGACGWIGPYYGLVEVIIHISRLKSGTASSHLGKRNTGVGSRWKGRWFRLSRQSLKVQKCIWILHAITR